MFLAPKPEKWRHNLTLRLQSEPSVLTLTEN